MNIGLTKGFESYLNLSKNFQKVIENLGFVEKGSGKKPF